MNFFLKIPVFFFSLLYPIKVYGKENIPEGGAVFAANHFRACDCGYIVRVYKKKVKFLAKKEIFKNKLFNKILKAYGAIPIDRENPDMSSLLTAIKYIKEGHKLCIFAEGKRNTTGTTELQEIKGGSVVFAVKAKCPIVPIMLSRKGKILRKTHIIVGEPFYLDEYYGKKLSDEDIKRLGEFVRGKMIEQQSVLFEKINKKKKKK